MTVRKYTRIHTYDHVDYTRRIFMLKPSSPKALSMAPRAWRDMDILVDSDDPEPKITVPYGPWDPDHFVIAEVMDATFLTLGETDGNGDYQVQASYYIRGSGPSLTSPDKFWTFDCIKDPFAFASISTKQYVTGRWDATPEPNDAKLPFIVCNDNMIQGRSFMLPRLPRYEIPEKGSHQLVFIKISTKEYVGVRDGRVFRLQDTPATYYMLGVCGDPSVGVNFVNDPTQGTYRKYPSISDIMGSIDNLGTTDGGDVFGITPSAILDISVSERAPIQINDDLSMTDAGLMISINNRDYAKAIYAHTYFDSASRSEDVVLPQLTEMEEYTANASIRTTNDDMLCNIPIQALKGGTMSIRSISDMTGLYTEVTLNGSRMMMPEGKLPYVGSAWAEYAVAQQSYDRENMTLAIQNARSEALQSTAMNAANGVLTGALIGGPLGAAGGAATTLLGIAGTGLELQRNERTAKRQQDLKEKMLQNSVGTSYNTGYGLEYLRKADRGTCRIQLDVPQHLTQQMFDDYVKWHGYPAGGLESTIRLGTPGYVQGYITLNLIGFPTSIGKYQLDRANKELMEGVRFIDTA